MFRARSVIPKKDAPDSICPSGWHLPSSTGTGSYTTLVQNYVGREGNTDGPENIDSAVQLPQLNFTLSGYYMYYNGSIQTMNGFFWSKSRYGAQSHLLDFTKTYLYPRRNYGRGYGLTLRCLAR